MTRPGRYPQELRQRAVRLVFERQRLKMLERENRELRRANEILKSAAAFFGAELDRRPTR
jgi:transposase-like protein